ncbi:hypothetical protein GCM10010123_30000 [Pilimelia anulata]|uniref:Uncharacterized protein n=1 Tax=Pilimelia anulata TaxID=53371 RepID=A0A8J3FAK1_9ACTN|nr:hypothetical protein GCM10010123_30000 [Pilimelia anulata]
MTCTSASWKADSVVPPVPVAETTGMVAYTAEVDMDISVRVQRALSAHRAAGRGGAARDEG